MTRRETFPATTPLGGNVADASVAPVCNTGASVTSIGAAREGAARSRPSFPDRQTGEASAPNLSTYSFRTEPCIHHDTATATSCDECARGYMDCVCVDCGELRPLNNDGECKLCHDSNTLSSADFELLYPTRIAPLPEGWSRVAY